MRISVVLPIAAVLFLLGHPASAQSRDPYFSTFSANYDFVYHETGATSNVGAHFDVASTLKRTEPFIGPVGEIGFNHFDGGTVVSAMGGLRVRANTDYWLLPYAQFVLGLYHCGVCDIKALRTETEFIQVTTAGLRESHPHDVVITREAPNYSL